MFTVEGLIWHLCFVFYKRLFYNRATNYPWVIEELREKMWMHHIRAISFAPGTNVSHWEIKQNIHVGTAINKTTKTKNATWNHHNWSLASFSKQTKHGWHSKIQPTTCLACPCNKHKNVTPSVPIWGQGTVPVNLWMKMAGTRKHSNEASCVSPWTPNPWSEALTAGYRAKNKRLSWL